MAYFRFTVYQDKNKDDRLATLNDIRPKQGQEWVKWIDGTNTIIRPALNQYIPSNNEAILFKVESINQSVNADQGRLLKLCYESKSISL